MHSHTYQPDVVVVPGRSLSPDVQLELQSLVVEAISIPLSHAARELPLLDPRLVMVSDEAELTSVRLSLREGHGERPLVVAADWPAPLCDAAISSGLANYVLSSKLSPRQLAREVVGLLEELRNTVGLPFRTRQEANSRLSSHPPSSGIRAQSSGRSAFLTGDRASTILVSGEPAEIARIRLKKARKP